MDDALLVGVLDGVADLHEEAQPLAASPDYSGRKTP